MGIRESKYLCCNYNPVKSDEQSNYCLYTTFIFLFTISINVWWHSSINKTTKNWWCWPLQTNQENHRSPARSRSDLETLRRIHFFPLSARLLWHVGCQDGKKTHMYDSKSVNQVVCCSWPCCSSFIVSEHVHSVVDEFVWVCVRKYSSMYIQFSC